MVQKKDITFYFQEGGMNPIAYRQAIGSTAHTIQGRCKNSKSSGRAGLIPLPIGQFETPIYESGSLSILVS